MARIRSIHPGQNQDEDFVEMSAEARLVCILLRCEADDQGVFEWKPKGLKMKLIPGDDWDIDSLLSEMLDCQQVKRFEVDGRPYGAIRNFRKYQRPQKPNAVYPCPREVREYVGLPVEENETETGTVRETSHAPATPLRDQYDTATGIAPQMEDGGGKREEGEKEDIPPVVPPDGGKAKPSRRKAKTALPEMDGLPDAWREAGHKKGWPDDRLEAEFEKFCERQRQHDARYADWLATWRNWLNRAPEFARSPPRSPAQQPMNRREIAMQQLRQQMESDDGQSSCTGDDRTIDGDCRSERGAGSAGGGTGHLRLAASAY